jgi:hypothetical protein
MIMVVRVGVGVVVRMLVAVGVLMAVLCRWRVL